MSSDSELSCDNLSLSDYAAELPENTKEDETERSDAKPKRSVDADISEVMDGKRREVISGNEGHDGKHVSLPFLTTWS